MTLRNHSLSGGTRGDESSPRRTRFFALIALVAALGPAVAGLQDGPDLALSSIAGITSLGREGTHPDGVNGLSFSTTICNVGDTVAAWRAPMDEAHPGVALQLYRVGVDDDGVERLQQIGLSWVSHGFAAVGQSFCEACAFVPDITLLPAGCSTTSSATTLGDRFWLGPRGEWSAHAQAWTCLASYFDGTPVDCIRDENGAGLGPVDHRLVVRDDDLGLPGATYFYEANVLAADDVDVTNSIASRECTMVWTGTTWAFQTPVLRNPTTPGPAVLRWGDVQSVASPGANPALADVHGRAVLAAQVTDLGTGGPWRYEYAVFHWDLSDHIDSLELIAGSDARDFSFSDVNNDARDDWNATLQGDVLVWHAPVQQPNTEPGGGELTFGVLYNFGFTSDHPPTSGALSLDLALLGQVDDSFPADTLVPDIDLTWVNWGSGKPGAGGITPFLDGSGDLTPGSPGLLALTDGTPHRTAHFVVGFSQLGAHFKGGSLVPAPALYLAPLPLDVDGALTLPFTWPSGVPSDFAVFMQAWVSAPGISFGFSASNGLRALTP